MKRYTNLPELLKDYREYKGIAQIDLAGLLDVDVRTVNRWEKGVSLIKPDKEKQFAEALFIPFMVIRHLNSETPLPVYYSFEDRVYSLNAFGKKIVDSKFFLVDVPVDDQDVKVPEGSEDYEFINTIAELREKVPYASERMLKKAAFLLPELNMILFDQAGTYAGCMVVFPLKQRVYEKIKSGEMTEDMISERDIVDNTKREPFVYFYYVLYADSLNSTFYLVKHLFSHLKKSSDKYSDVFAGFSCKENQIKLLTDIGFDKAWEELIGNSGENKKILLEGRLEKLAI